METPLVTITLDEYKRLVKERKEIPEGSYAVTVYSNYSCATNYTVKGEVSDLVKELEKINLGLVNKQYDLCMQLQSLQFQLIQEQNTPWWKRIFK